MSHLILNVKLLSETLNQKLENLPCKNSNELRVSYIIYDPFIKIQEGKLTKANKLNGFEWIGHLSIYSEAVKIKYDIDNASSNYDKEQNQERLAKLAGGVAILRIGAESEIEMKEKKDRVEDALNATRAALDEGIVSGGGVALRWTVDNPTAEFKVKTENSDQKLGVEIVKEACREPFNCIMENSGFTPEVIWNKVYSKMASEYAEDNQYDTSWGYDAIKEEVVDMFEAGIIDPAKVVRVALQHAASVAGMLLTTECVISDIPEETPDMPPMGGGGMPGMM